MLCALLERMNMYGQKSEMSTIILWKILFAKLSHLQQLQMGYMIVLWSQNRWQYDILYQMILLFCMEGPYLIFEKLETKKNCFFNFWYLSLYTVTHIANYGTHVGNMTNFDIFPLGRALRKINK